MTTFTLPVIGMRDAIYKDSTPMLHVGDSAFEDWFQAQSFACQEGIKQMCRDSYAAGMGDPLVTYANPQEARIAELEAQTDAEPVAWTWWETSIVGMHPITFARVNLTKPEVQPNMLMLAPLYTHPPKQAKAITAEDVTDEMIAEIDAKDKAFDYSKIDMSSDTALRDAKKHAVVEIFNTVIDTFNGVKP